MRENAYLNAQRPSLSLLLLSSALSLTVGLTTPYAEALKASATLNLEGALRASAPVGAPSSEGHLVVAAPIWVDLDQLTGLKLGALSAQGMLIKEGLGGEGPTLLGDDHAYSNLRAEDRAQLFELFWERAWSQLTARVGKLDANDHFAVSEHESLLINGASGFSPSILGMPSYPDSAWSAQLSYQLDRFDLAAGVFDGGGTTLNPTPTGARWGLSPAAYQGELFWVAQVTMHLGKLHSAEQLQASSALLSPQQDRGFTARAPLHLTFGAWAHSGGIYQPLESSGPSAPSGGLYMTGDLTLAELSRGGELGLGLQAAVSPHSYPLHLSAALTCTELTTPLAWADSGLIIALGASALSRSNELQSLKLEEREALLELTATLPLSGWMTTSLSLMNITGDHLSGGRAHLVISRVTLGSQ